MENAWLAGTGEAGPLDDLIGHSIAYRIAVSPRAGQKLFTLQTVPARTPESLADFNGAARAGGFSLHAGIGIALQERAKLERLCRYVSRPPVATARLGVTPSGHVCYAPKTPVPRRHDAHCDGAVGCDGKTGGAGAAAADAATTVCSRRTAGCARR